MDFWTKWRVFASVVEHRSFTAAARTLHLTQPTVSQYVKALEEHYGLRLLEREAHRFELTAAGAKVYHFARQALALHSELEEEMSRLRSREEILRIGATRLLGSRLLPDWISGFRTVCPQAVVRLEVGDTEAVCRDVLDHRLDLGVVVGPPPTGPFAIEPLFQEDLCTVARPDALDPPAPGGGSGPLIHPWEPAAFVMPRAHSLFRAIIEGYLTQVGLPFPRVVAEVGDMEAMKRLALEGTGWAVVARETVSDELAQGRLQEIPPVDAAGRPIAAPVVEYLLIRRSDARRSSLQVRFERFLRREAAAR